MHGMDNFKTVNRGSYPVEGGTSMFPDAHISSGTQPALVGTGNSLLLFEAVGAWSWDSPPSKAEFKIWRSRTYTPTSPHRATWCAPWSTIGLCVCTVHLPYGHRWRTGEWLKFIFIVLCKGCPTLTHRGATCFVKGSPEGRTSAYLYQNGWGVLNWLMDVTYKQ